MKRRRDWRARLHEEIERHRRVPFSWGDGSDCAMFAADCVKAMTGDDPAARFRGRYATAFGALRAVREAGFADLADAISDTFEEIHPSRARVGDVACFPSDGHFGMTVGIVIGERVAVSFENGIGSACRTEAVRAFKVP
ncbi:MAG: DUF6950 family protein [Albidovulum sp.]